MEKQRAASKIEDPIAIRSLMFYLKTNTLRAVERIINKEKTTLHLVRHGEAQPVDFHKQPNSLNDSLDGDYFYYNPELTPKGLNQALETIKDERMSQTDILIASPSRRTRQTANPIGRHWVIRSLTAYELRDCGFCSRWDSVIIESIFASPNPEQLFTETFFSDLPFVFSFYALTYDALVKIINRWRGGTITLVTHGEVIEAIYYLFNGRINDFPKADLVKEYDYCSINTIELPL